MMKAITSYQFDSGSNPRGDAICGLRLIVVGYLLALRDISASSPVFPSPQKRTFRNSNSIRNGRRRTTLWTCYHH